MLDKINNRLNEYEKKIESLTQTISDLQAENKNLQIKNLEHMKNRNYLLEIENNNKILSEDQKNIKSNRTWKRREQKYSKKFRIRNFIL